jgi:uncharacterized protein (TIGR03000 family)
MLRKTIGFMSVLAVIAAFAAEQAHAGWHHRHAGYGSYGSSGGSWGSSGGSWGSSGGSWGSSGGYYRASWGSSGGSWGSSGGSWGSSGGSSGGSWGSSGGSSGGSWGSSGGSSGGYQVVPSSPATPAAPAQPATPPATPPGPSDAGPAPTNSTFHPTYGPLRNSALLNVKVPEDAKVFVNDRETTSKGASREYISRDLQNGARYNYEVRAEFVRDGKTVSETQSIQLGGGQNGSLDFTGAATVQTAELPVKTSLIIHVPADAKLFLAGHPTKATGEVREFTTTRLNAGSEWTTYSIRAEIERDGKTQVREEQVSLKAGESRDLSISFDGPATGDQIANASSR